MAKKENFGFNTNSKPKAGLELNLEFLNNIKFLDKLTYKQKKIAFFSSIIALVLVIAIAVTCIVIGVNGGFGGNNNSGNNGGNSGGDGTSGAPEIPETINNLYVFAAPNDCSYYVNDPADYTGLILSIKNEFGDDILIDYSSYKEEIEIEGFDSSAPAEEQVITVKFRGQSTTFTIEIIPAHDFSVKLEKISISTLPKTTYKSGSAFNPTGGVILCEYSDGSEGYVDLDSDGVVIHGYREIYKTVGEHDLRVVYFDANGKSAETTLTVIITE